MLSCKTSYFTQFFYVTVVSYIHLKSSILKYLMFQCNDGVVHNLQFTGEYVSGQNTFIRLIVESYDTYESVYFQQYSVPQIFT